MSSRGRDKFRREISSRSEEKGHHGRSNPPSRHLWIGNLSHSLDENTLARQFLQFGELDSIAFQPGRSYAFVNFKNEDDAYAAIRELQGFSVAGNPLRIEFAKAEKSTSRNDDYLQHREQRSAARASPYPQRDSRARHFSPDAENSRMTDKNGEPSEVLWIGFPAQLKVDEFILRKAFAPFGEIDKITAFPGRTYAFVRYRNVLAACRAKETLQGKLFGNPRVHICFAKSESGVSNRERNSSNTPSSPHFRGYAHSGSSEKFHHDRDYRNLVGDPIRCSPSYLSNREPDDPDLVNFGRKNNAWATGDGAFERRKFTDLGSERLIPGNIYEQRISPSRDRISHFQELSPERFSHQGPEYDDPFDLPEDPLLFHEVKKLKTCTFPSQSELPEYPFIHSGQGNHMPSKAFPDPDSYGKSLDPEPFGYRHIPNRQTKSVQSYGERSDQRSISYDSLHMGSVPIPTYSEQQRLALDSRVLSKKEEWKWEGTIAKGGTPVCRARCFPVGKELDMKLPEYLDCTARTGLDMLSKHYYQAAGSWVVFFVPASDPDMIFYNEFMTYLGEKQRAAVAKLDDINTLFLVPPSEFSEKVLKVPGRLSISGVVLRLEQPGLTYGSFHHQQEKSEANFASLQGDPLAIQQASPSGPYPSVSGNVAFTGTFSAGTSGASHARPAHTGGDLPEHEYALHRHNTMIASSWPSHDMESITSDPRNIASLNIPNPVSRTSSQQPLQENPPIPSSTPVAVLQPEQLAQLATSFLGQQRQPGAVSTSSDWAHQKYLLPNNQVSSEISSSQYAQMQQQQQVISSMSPATQKEFQPGSQVNQQPQYLAQEEGDTEKRLQATLQLAAALLQQIQQGKST